MQAMQIIRFMTILFLSFSFLVISVQSQDSENIPTIESADKFFAESSWKEAAIAYSKIVENNPSVGQAWLRLGFSLHNLGQFEEAVAAYEESEELKFAPAATRYNLACSYARMNDFDRALGWLELAVEAGYGNVHSLKNDSDLVSIRSDKKFASILEKADKISRPCENDPAYGVLDFWIGEWDVLSSKGEKMGTNSIVRILSGCAVTEHWIGKSGFEGQSLFYYNNVTYRWTQVWITGRATAPGGMKEKYLLAVYEDGGVRFQGEYLSESGANILDRTTLSPLADGRVRQVIERSVDGGNSWTVGFDGYYSRK